MSPSFPGRPDRRRRAAERELPGRRIRGGLIGSGLDPANGRSAFRSAFQAGPMALRRRSVRAGSISELRARFRAVLRRTSDHRSPRITIQDLELEPATLGVKRGDRRIRLTAREFALLELLARHPGQIFGQDRLIDALWDADFAAESNIVEVYVRSLRRKIDDGRRNGLIETVRGSGYRLRAAPPDFSTDQDPEPDETTDGARGDGVEGARTET